MFSPSPEPAIIIPASLALLHPVTDTLPKIHVIIRHILKNKYKIPFLQETANSKPCGQVFPYGFWPSVDILALCACVCGMYSEHFGFLITPSRPWTSTGLPFSVPSLLQEAFPRNSVSYKLFIVSIWYLCSMAFICPLIMLSICYSSIVIIVFFRYSHSIH